MSISPYDRFEQRLRALEDNLDRLSNDVRDLLKERRAGREGPAFSELGFPSITRGQAVTFQADGDGTPFLGAGWWQQEKWGVWDKGLSELRLHADDYRGGSLDVSLAIQTLGLSGAPKPAVSIVANGYFIGKYEVGRRDHVLRLRIPPSAVATKGDVQLQLTHNRPAVPAQLFGNADERMIGVGLIRLERLC